MYGEDPLASSFMESARQAPRRTSGVQQSDGPAKDREPSRSVFAGAAGAAGTASKAAQSAKQKASAEKKAADDGFTHAPSPFDDDPFTQSSLADNPFDTFGDDGDGASESAPGNASSGGSAAGPGRPAQQDNIQQSAIPAFYAERRDDSNPFAIGQEQKKPQEPSAPKKRFCENCGAEIAQGSKFCTNCGTKL